MQNKYLSYNFKDALVHLKLSPKQAKCLEPNKLNIVKHVHNIVTDNADIYQVFLRTLWIMPICHSGEINVA